MKSFKVSLYLFAASIFLLTGCGGGGGGGGSVTPALPSDAVTIDATNAGSIASSAVATFETAYAVSGVDATTYPSVQTAINLITDTAFNYNKRSSNVVSGVTDSWPCSGGGTIDDTYSYTATSASGSMTFNNCNEAGFTFQGTFSYSYTWNNTTYDYSGTVNGSLTLGSGGNSFTMALDMDESGNDLSGAFSINMSFSLSGIPNQGFLATTTTPLTGTGLTITGGVIVVEGANNTRLRITITSSISADVELDNGSGTFAPHSTISI